MKNERGEGKRKGDRGKVIKGGARDKQEKQEEARQRKTERRRKGVEERGRQKEEERGRKKEEEYREGGR